MTIATDDSKSGELATSIEQCECPDGYEGLSCQQCSKGFTRGLRVKRRQSSLRYPPCDRCHCNGRAETCNPITGVCMVNYTRFTPTIAGMHAGVKQLFFS